MEDVVAGFALGPFAASVGDAFEVVAVPALRWTLAAAEGQGDVVDPATHRAFSLSFRAPADPVYAQQMVTLRHPVLGEHAIFVVPTARDPDGVTYQAVFN